MANSDRGHGTGPDPADQPEHRPAPDRVPDAQASPDLPAAPAPSSDEPPAERAPAPGQSPGASQPPEFDQAPEADQTGPAGQPGPGSPPRRIELTVAELLGRTPLAAAGRRPTRHSVHAFEKMSPRRRAALTAGAVVAAGSVVAAALFAPSDFLRPREQNRTNSDGEPESRPPTPGAAADSRSALPTGAPNPASETEVPDTWTPPTVSSLPLPPLAGPATPNTPGPWLAPPAPSRGDSGGGPNRGPGLAAGAPPGGSGAADRGPDRSGTGSNATGTGTGTGTGTNGARSFGVNSRGTGPTSANSANGARANSANSANSTNANGGNADRAGSTNRGTGPNEARASNGSRTADTGGANRSSAPRATTADSRVAGSTAVGPVEVPVTDLADEVPVADLLPTSDGTGRHVGRFDNTRAPAGTALSSLTEPIGPSGLLS